MHTTELTWSQATFRGLIVTRSRLRWCVVTFHGLSDSLSSETIINTSFLKNIANTLVPTVSL